MAKRRTIYRDSKTGRFVKKSTWIRSKSKGGTRYKRVYVQPPKKLRPPARAEVPSPAAPDIFEWIVSFSYRRSNRSFDVIVTAASRTDALSTAKEFLKRDTQYAPITFQRNGFTNWNATIAQGNRTDSEAGNAEYRSKSRASRKKRLT